eukprot:TRINITY_DN12098_c0_g1_i1.p1 TRINITY_DN12098_c0_g1~~TRINITY_DN12098_c0_g1_i1.p1  ORF type:complete len:556 (-),score=182.35 TRINITY_DN12098_c0_g1_i1:19-1659(-)
MSEDELNIENSMFDDLFSNSPTTINYEYEINARHTKSKSNDSLNLSKSASEARLYFPVVQIRHKSEAISFEDESSIDHSLLSVLPPEISASISSLVHGAASPSFSDMFDDRLSDCTEKFRVDDFQQDSHSNQELNLKDDNSGKSLDCLEIETDKIISNGDIDEVELSLVTKDVLELSKDNEDNFSENIAVSNEYFDGNIRESEPSGFSEDVSIELKKIDDVSTNSVDDTLTKPIKAEVYSRGNSTDSMDFISPDSSSSLSIRVESIDFGDTNSNPQKVSPTVDVKGVKNNDNLSMFVVVENIETFQNDEAIESDELPMVVSFEGDIKQKNSAKDFIDFNITTENSQPQDKGEKESKEEVFIHENSCEALNNEDVSESNEVMIESRTENPSDAHCENESFESSEENDSNDLDEFFDLLSVEEYDIVEDYDVGDQDFLFEKAPLLFGMYGRSEGKEFVDNMMFEIEDEIRMSVIVLNKSENDIEDVLCFKDNQIKAEIHIPPSVIQENLNLITRNVPESLIEESLENFSVFTFEQYLKVVDMFLKSNV